MILKGVQNNVAEIELVNKKIISALTSTKRKGIENLVDWLSGSNFFTSPASTRFHGNFEGGLALHSYEVYKEFFAKVGSYGLEVQESSAIIAGICHDICKVNYYIPNRLKKGELSEAKPYKVEDNFPLGHGEKSVLMASRYIPLTDQEALMIRWHMGYEDPLWNDYKEKVELKFPEVVLFQHADKEVSLIRQI
jgi:hypothetical protein